MSDLKTSTQSNIGGLIVAIAGAGISIMLWVVKINPDSDLAQRLDLPPGSTTGWSGLAVVAAICGGVALLFAIVRGLVNKRGITGLTVLLSIVALSFPAGIVLGAVVPKHPGP